MTDKQIIIDGVDVSGCGFYHSVTGTECHIALAFAEEYTDNDHTYLKCEQNPNCYYKQLKRKEQECEELKRLIAKQKNAKIQLSKLKDKQYKEFCDMKQTLADIKEIAEMAIKEMYATKSDDYTDGYRWLGSIILQKISEVEDDR